MSENLTPKPNCYPYNWLIHFVTGVLEQPAKQTLIH